MKIGDIIYTFLPWDGSLIAEMKIESTTSNPGCLLVSFVSKEEGTKYFFPRGQPRDNVTFIPIERAFKSKKELMKVWKNEKNN